MTYSVRDTGVKIFCNGGEIRWGGKEYPMPPPAQLTYFGKAVEWLNNHEGIQDFVMYRPTYIFQCILGVGLVYTVHFAFKATPWALLGLALVPIYLAIRTLREKITIETQNQEEYKNEIRIAQIYEKHKGKIEEDKKRVIEMLGGEEAFNALPILEIKDLLKPPRREEMEKYVKESLLAEGDRIIMKGVGADGRPFVYVKIETRSNKKPFDLFVYQYTLNTSLWQHRHLFGLSKKEETLDVLQELLNDENKKYVISCKSS